MRDCICISTRKHEINSEVDAKREKRKENHEIGAAIIDLRFDAADNDPEDVIGRGNGRIVFSFSSDAEPDERSTSDDDVDASFAWRNSSVPDIDVGRCRLTPVIVAGGDLVAVRPSREDVDGTRT